MIGRITNFIYVLMITSLLSAALHLPIAGTVLLFFATTFFMYGFIGDKVQKFSVINASVNFLLSYAIVAGVGYYLSRLFGIPARALLIFALIWGGLHIAKTMILDEWEISGYNVPSYILSGFIYSTAICYTFTGYEIKTHFLLGFSLIFTAIYTMIRTFVFKQGGEHVTMNRQLDNLLSRISTIEHLAEYNHVSVQLGSYKDKIEYMRSRIGEVAQDEFDSFIKSMQDELSDIMMSVFVHREEEQAQPIQFFAGCTTKSEIRQRFRELSKQYHPDNPGGDAEVFKLISEEYNKLQKTMAG